LITAENEEDKMDEDGASKILTNDLPMPHTHLVNAVFIAAEALDAYNVN